MTDMNAEQVKVPIQNLPSERQERIAQLDTHTDDIFRLRTQLAQFYIYNREYLPTVDRDGHAHKLRLSELNQRVLGGDKIENLIDFERADLAVDSKFSSSEQRALEKAKKHLTVTAHFKRGLRVYKELKAKGGTWNEDDVAQEQQEVRNYYKMRFGEVASAKQQFDKSLGDLDQIEELEDLMRSDSDFIIRADVIRELETQRAQIQEGISILVKESPEAYVYVLGLQLLDAKNSFDNHGTIIETPSIKSKIDHILSEIETGRPVFIHGELGTGKTELAKHIARTRLSKKHLDRWERNNPSPIKTWDEQNPKPENIKEIPEWNEARKAMFDSGEQRTWEAQRALEAEALEIPGHRGIEQEQILAARSVKRVEPTPPEEQLAVINNRWERWKAEREDEIKASAIPQDRKGALERLNTVERELFEQAYLETFKTPIETTTILAPMLRAMKEGRPLIIDEMNGIPHHVLIVLNDLLPRRPGETVTPPFPEIPPFVVQDGFCVMATGNYKPEDGIMYIGRQPIDAAFLSRFAPISYDYLPMSVTFEDPALTDEQKREAREENELFQMLIARFLNKDLSLELPEGGLEKIRKLATVARNLQDVFSGNDVSRAYFANVGGAQVKPQDVLKENVPSIRHLIPVLDLWREGGFKKDLDDYLYLAYVSRSDARPEEKLYIYSVLQTQGDFFPQAEGWPSATLERDKVLRFPIEQQMYGTEKLSGRRQAVVPNKSQIFYSVKDVVEALYGPAPKRSYVTEQFVEEKKPTQPTSPDDINEEQLERLRLLEHINQGLGDIFGAGYQDRFEPPKR